MQGVRINILRLSDNIIIMGESEQELSEQLHKANLNSFEQRVQFKNKSVNKTKVIVCNKHGQ